MTRALYLLTVLATLSIAAQNMAPRPLPFPSEKLHWIRIRSTHFDVISSATLERTSAIVSDLETMAAVLKHTSTRFQTAAAATTIFVFADRSESEAWFELLLGPGHHHLGGAHVRYAGGSTMIIDGANARRIERTAMHELVHDLLRQSDHLPPLWLEEGLAEYFSGARVKRGRIEAGFTVPQHALILSRQRHLMTLETMFAVQPETPAATAPLFYAQSWAAVDWLMQLDSSRFYALLEDLEHGTRVADALSSRYGKSPLELESAIRRRGGVNGVTVTFENPARAPVPPAVDMDRATLLYELGRFLTDIPGARLEADRHFHEALRIDPKNERALAALGRFEQEKLRGAELTEGVKRANELAQAGKFGDAATLIRELAASTDETAVKRDLEGQAAQLDNAAALIQQIRMYNEAIELAKTNHYADALAILEDILKEATDAEMIADATQLRDELRKQR